jgi:hypothetical protein
MDQKLFKEIMDQMAEEGQEFAEAAKPLIEYLDKKHDLSKWHKFSFYIKKEYVVNLCLTLEEYDG